MAASLRVEDLQPVMLNSIALFGATIQTFSDPLLKMHCYGSKRIAHANKKIIRIRRLRIKMFYFLLLHLCISSCKSAKQTTPVCQLRLSTALY